MAHPVLPQGEESPLLAARDSVERLTPVRSAMRWVGRYVHPNRITALRLLGTPVAMVATRVSNTAAATAFAVNSLLDWVDGAVARSCPGSKTQEGAMLDPLIDKLSHATALGYLVAQHSHDVPLAVAASASVALNAVSQLQRGRLGAQLRDAWRGVVSPESCEVIEDATDARVKRVQANAIGKLKHVLECIAITALFASGEDDHVRMGAAAGLAVSSGLAVLSTLKRKADVTHT